MNRADLIKEWMEHYRNAVRFGSSRPDIIANILTFSEAQKKAMRHLVEEIRKHPYLIDELMVAGADDVWSDSVMNRDEAEKMVRVMSSLVGYEIRLTDYIDWLRGGPGYRRFDIAAMKILGECLFWTAEKIGMLPDVLLAFISHEERVPATIAVKGMEFNNVDNMPNRKKQ